MVATDETGDSLSLSLSLCLSASATAAQLGQVWIVDGNQPPSPPYSHTSISAAAAVADAGDTIRVKALVWQGNVGAYAETSTGESYPIAILPGVTLEAYDPSQAVYVVTTTSGTTLFIVPETTAPAPVTTLKDLRLLGAQQAVALATPQGDEIDVVLQTLLFGRNRVGVAAIADGGHIRILLDQCQIVDNGASVPSPAPVAQQFQVGFGFHASNGVNAGRVDATIQSLTTAGPFNGMSQDPITHLDLHGLGGASKLVSVTTGNGIPEHPFQDQGDPFTRQTIPTVALTVNGGIWNGKAATGDRGWDFGLFAMTEPGVVATAGKDYYSAFDVQFHGAELRGFREAGIYAGATTETRGIVGLNGGTKVRLTGDHGAGNPDDLRYSGIVMISRESYLALLGDDAEILDNRGNGILAYTPGSVAVPVNYPQGLYLGLEGCGIHQNGLDGLYLAVAKDKGQILSLDHGGIVGGTWDDFPVNQVSSIRFLHMVAGDIASKPMPELKQGEGFLNRCRISNNGLGSLVAHRSGIRAEVYGNAYEDQDGVDSRFAAVAASVVNSFVWNNPGGGFTAELDHSAGTGGWPGPLMLTPFVHTTVAGNGDQSGYNLEVVEVDGPGTGTYFYDDQPYDLTFRIFDSIFERKTSTDFDFGPYFTANLGYDDLNQTVPPIFIGLAGLRSSQTFINPQSWTTFATPFIVSPITWTSLDPAQFFLNSGGPNIGQFQDYCPPYLPIEAVLDESTVDYSFDLRPVAFQLRDKGAEEL